MGEVIKITLSVQTCCCFIFVIIVFIQRLHGRKLSKTEEKTGKKKLMAFPHSSTIAFSNWGPFHLKIDLAEHTLSHSVKFGSYMKLLNENSILRNREIHPLTLVT